MTKVLIFLMKVENYWIKGRREYSSSGRRQKGEAERQ